MCASRREIFQPTEFEFEFGFHYLNHCAFKEPLGRFKAKWTQKRKIHLHVFCGDNLDSDNIAFHQQLQHMCCEIAPALPSNFARSWISTRQKQLLPPIGQCQYRQKWTYSASRARSKCLGRSKETVLHLAVKPSDKSWQDSGKSSSPKDSTTNKTIMMITSALWRANPVLRILGGEHCRRIKTWALETNHQVENPCSATYWRSDPEPVTEPHWASVSSSVKWG